MSGAASTTATGKLRPLGNRVLLRKIESDMQGGVIRPHSTEPEESTTQEYEVVVGKSVIDFESSDPPNTIYRTFPIPVGARIYLARHKGWKIETRDGEELYVADVEDILAVEESA